MSESTWLESYLHPQLSMEGAIPSIIRDRALDPQELDESAIDETTNPYISPRDMDLHRKYLRQMRHNQLFQYYYDTLVTKIFAKWKAQINCNKLFRQNKTLSNHFHHQNLIYKYFLLLKTNAKQKCWRLFTLNKCFQGWRRQSLDTRMTIIRQMKLLKSTFKHWKLFHKVAVSYKKAFCFSNSFLLDKSFLAIKSLKKLRVRQGKRVYRGFKRNQVKHMYFRWRQVFLMHMALYVFQSKSLARSRHIILPIYFKGLLENVRKSKERILELSQTLLWLKVYRLFKNLKNGILNLRQRQTKSLNQFRKKWLSKNLLSTLNQASRKMKVTKETNRISRKYFIKWLQKFHLNKFIMKRKVNQILLGQLRILNIFKKNHRFKQIEKLLGKKRIGKTKMKILQGLKGHSERRQKLKNYQNNKLETKQRGILRELNTYKISSKQMRAAKELRTRTVYGKVVLGLLRNRKSEKKKLGLNNLSLHHDRKRILKKYFVKLSRYSIKHELLQNKLQIAVAHWVNLLKHKAFSRLINFGRILLLDGLNTTKIQLVNIRRVKGEYFSHWKLRSDNRKRMSDIYQKIKKRCELKMKKAVINHLCLVTKLINEEQEGNYQTGMIMIKIQELKGAEDCIDKTSINCYKQDLTKQYYYKKLCRKIFQKFRGYIQWVNHSRVQYSFYTENTNRLILAKCFQKLQSYSQISKKISDFYNTNLKEKCLMGWQIRAKLQIKYRVIYKYFIAKHLRLYFTKFRGKLRLRNKEKEIWEEKFGRSERLKYEEELIGSRHQRRIIEFMWKEWKFIYRSNKKERLRSERDTLKGEVGRIKTAIQKTAELSVNAKLAKFMRKRKLLQKTFKILKDSWEYNKMLTMKERYQTYQPMLDIQPIEKENFSVNIKKYGWGERELELCKSEKRLRKKEIAEEVKAHSAREIFEAKKNINLQGYGKVDELINEFYLRFSNSQKAILDKIELFID